MAEDHQLARPQGRVLRQHPGGRPLEQRERRPHGSRTDLTALLPPLQVGGRSGLLLSHPNNGAYTGEQQPSSSHKFAVLVHDGSGDAIGDFERDGGFGELKLSPLNVRTSGRASKIFEEDLEADGDYERGHADGSVFLELGESLEYPIGTR